VQQNFQRFRVRREHDKLANASVQRLGRFVGAFFQLLVVVRLLDDVEDADG